MSLRRRHTEAEIRRLADHFRESWSDGQLIKSWLRAHADELRDLVKREDWAWENIGKALTYAGIRYQTGNLWRGENLRKEVIKACVPRKPKKPLKEMADSKIPPSLASYLNKIGPSETGEPEFQIIRSRQQLEKAATISNPALSPTPRPLRKFTDQEIHLIAMGRSDLIHG